MYTVGEYIRLKEMEAIAIKAKEMKTIEQFKTFKQISKRIPINKN